MSPAARLTLGAIQSVNSTSSTFKPCLSASATAASRGIAKAAVVPTFSGASAANTAELNKPKARGSALTGWVSSVFFILGVQSSGVCKHDAINGGSWLACDRGLSGNNFWLTCCYRRQASSHRLDRKSVGGTGVLFG